MCISLDELKHVTKHDQDATKDLLRQCRGSLADTKTPPPLVSHGLRKSTTRSRRPSESTAKKRKTGNAPSIWERVAESARAMSAVPDPPSDHDKKGMTSRSRSGGKGALHASFSLYWKHFQAQVRVNQGFGAGVLSPLGARARLGHLLPSFESTSRHCFGLGGSGVRWGGRAPVRGSRGRTRCLETRVCDRDRVQHVGEPHATSQIAGEPVETVYGGPLKMRRSPGWWRL